MSEDKTEGRNVSPPWAWLYEIDRLAFNANQTQVAKLLDTIDILREALESSIRNQQWMADQIYISQLGRYLNALVEVEHRNYQARIIQHIEALDKASRGDVE